MSECRLERPGWRTVTRIAWASRGERLFARFIDGLAWGGLVLMAAALQQLTGHGALPLLGLLLVFATTQAWLLTTRGQQVGKILVGIRIVRPDGSPAGFARAVLLRDGLNMVLGTLCGLYSLVNHLLIFAADEQCLHDRIADTRVVRADPKD